MASEQYDWDFFIAHAGADKRVAEKLYSCLQPSSRVFLDSRSLLPGDDWDVTLPAAQQRSLMTVVLISSKTEAAYYQREEIAAAIALARKNAEKHRVVPVFLDQKAGSNGTVPYGLRTKHGYTVSAKLSLKLIAKQLLDFLSQLTKDASHKSKSDSTEKPTPVLKLSGSIEPKLTKTRKDKPKKNPKGVPSAPMLKVAAFGYDYVSLEWMSIATDAQGFMIECCGGDNCADYKEIGRTDCYTTQYVHKKLNSNSTYKYRVCAFNAAGHSD